MDEQSWEAEMDVARDVLDANFHGKPFEDQTWREELWQGDWWFISSSGWWQQDAPQGLQASNLKP